MTVSLTSVFFYLMVRMKSLQKILDKVQDASISKKSNKSEVRKWLKVKLFSTTDGDYRTYR